MNVGSAERRASLLVGSALALYAIRRSFGHLLLMGIGGYLAYRGITGNCLVYRTLGLSTAEEGERGISRRPAPRNMCIEKSVTVNKPAEQVYDYWHDLENLPSFMNHLESVSSTGDRRSHWIAQAPLKAEWDAEITDERPNEHIAWRSLAGSQVDTSGTVRFEPAPNGCWTMSHPQED